MIEKWKVEERRKFPRIIGKVPVKYRMLTNLSSLDFEVLERKVAKEYTKNFSYNGLCIKTRGIIPKNTILELVVDFPERSVKVLGRVVWSKEMEKPGEFYAGIEYIAVADNQVGAMTQSIAEFLINSYKQKENKGISALKDLIVHLLSKGK